MLKIKVPVKELEKKENVCDVVRNVLKSDKANAYTIMGIMVERFGVKEKEILGMSFKSWPKGHPSLYSKIFHCLKKLESEGFVKSSKHEKAMVFWWVKD